MLRGIGWKVLIVLCFISAAPNGAAYVRESGIPVGRPDGIYYVDSFEALEELGRLVAESDGDYTGEVWLMCDIEAVRPFEPIGNAAHSFSGIFDGRGYRISDLRIQDAGEFQGLFGYIGAQGRVKNLTVRDAIAVGRRYTGGIAAYSAGRIVNCRVIGGQVTGKSKQEYGAATGGVVGLNCGIIAGCEVVGTRVGGMRYAGGVAGSQCGGWIADCLSTAEVYSWHNGEALAGGISGAVQTGGVIERCVFAGKVRAGGAAWAGGIAGGILTGQMKKCLSFAQADGREQGGVAGYVSDRAQVIRCGYAGGEKGVGEGRQDGTERIEWKRMDRLSCGWIKEMWE